MISNPTLDDTAELAAFSARVFRHTWKHLYSEEVMARYLAQAFSLEQIRAYIEDPRYRYWLVKDGGKIVGYAKAGPPVVALEPMPENAVELHRLYVDEAHRRKGLGRALMDAFEEFARAHFKTALICVWSANKEAVPLYLAYGFHEAGQCYFPLGDFTNYEIDPDFILRKDYA